MFKHVRLSFTVIMFGVTPNKPYTFLSFIIKIKIIAKIAISENESLYLFEVNKLTI